MLRSHLSLVIPFCILYLLIHYQSIYLSKFKFKGASVKIEITVSIYRILGMMFGIFFLVFLGLKSVWFLPIVFLAISITIGFIFDIIFRFDKYDSYFCLLGIVVIPLDTIYMIYLMFKM
jgi:hypothetical protein